MVKLSPGNMLLKPSNRRQLMSWLKRAQTLGEQVGDFLLTIQFQRIGRFTEVTADVHNAAGDFTFRVKRPEWRDAARELVHMISIRLHAQRLNLPFA